MANDQKALEAAAKHSYEYEGDRRGIYYIGWDDEPESVKAEWRDSVREPITTYLASLPSDDEVGRLIKRADRRCENGKVFHAERTLIKELSVALQSQAAELAEANERVTAAVDDYNDALARAERAEAERDVQREAKEHARRECERAEAALAEKDKARIETYYARQIEWSRETFGPALRTGGVLDHIRKELDEIEADPHDLSEWVDVIILAMDGFWRHGGTVDDLMPRLLAKQVKNMARTWPDWRTMSEDQAIEHDRSLDAARRAHSKDGG